MWTFVADDSYLSPTAAPTGNGQARYLKSDATEPSSGWDSETDTLGVVYLPRPGIDAPQQISNDGNSTAEVVVSNLSSAKQMSVEITIGDLTTTQTIQPGGQHTETVTTTLPAGEMVGVSAETSYGEMVSDKIEVVAP